jgi:subfamily B ATP-binding cassette protein MsbA
MNEWLRLLSYSRRYWSILLLSVVLMAAAGAAHGLMVLLISPLIDRVLSPVHPGAPVTLFHIPVTGRAITLNQLIPGNVQDVWTLVSIAILSVFLAKGLFDYIANYLISYAGYSAVTDMRNAVFRKVLAQGAEFFENNPTGQLMSSILNDIDKIQVALSSMLADLMRQFFIAVALLFAVLNKDWKLAVVSLTVLPFVLIPTAKIGRRIRRTSRRTQDYTGEISSIMQEAITGHAVVKAFNTEAYELGRFQAAGKRLLRMNLRYTLQQAVASPLIEVFAALTIVGLISYARTHITSGELTAGQFTTFIVALIMLYEPVKRLTGIHNIFQQALGASQKVFSYLDRPADLAEKQNAPELPTFARQIEFRNVSFRYPAAPDTYAIHDLSMTVPAGEIVALVGPSGAGKSTLASLLPRFHDVTDGAVLIDGQDVRDVRLASIRAQIAIVAQDTFLFNDTVANNIAYGRTNVSRSEIEAAGEAALAHEFVLQMPHGYDTVIGERGLKLSGGQRQRLAIARAILKNAPVLILDEATSHLDTESEMLVQQAIANLMTGRTSIVIAHRLSTVRRADKIVVMERGRIAETGSHDDLVRRGGLYQRLHELQFLEAAIS